MKSIPIALGWLLVVTLTNAQVSVSAGREAFAAGRYREAEHIFQAIPENHAEFGPARYYLGRIAFQEKNYDDALDFFLEAVDNRPQDALAFNWLGDTYAAIGATANVFRQMSVGPKALRAWEKAAALDHKNIAARQSLASNYMIAPSFMGGGEERARAVAKEALVLLEEDLTVHPDHHLHQYWYGKLAALTGLNLANGAAWLKKYIEHTPSAEEPSVAMATMRLAQIEEKQGKILEARTHFDQAVRLDPKLKAAKEGLDRTSR